MQWMTEETGWILPEEEGISGTAATPEALLRLGAGLAGEAPRTAVGSEAGSPYGAACSDIICAGIAAAGGEALRVPDCIPAELSAAAGAGDCALLLHCGDMRQRLYARGMLPVAENVRKSVAEGEENVHWQHRTEYGRIEDGTSLRLLYPVRIRNRLPEHSAVKAEINTASARLRALLQPLFSSGKGKAVTFQLTADGRRASLYTDRDGWVFYEKLLMMECLRYLQRGEDVALPFWLPHTAEKLAEQYGHRILRYASHPDGGDSEARALALQQGFTLDAALLCADIVAALTEGETLAHWAAMLPPCYTVRRIVQTTDAEAAAVRCSAGMPSEMTPEGIRIKGRHGEALLRPSGSRKTLSVLVEADSMEAAAELTGNITGSAGSAGLHFAKGTEV